MLTLSFKVVMQYFLSLPLSYCKTLCFICFKVYDLVFPTLFNPSSADFIKWSNTLKQFVGKLPTNCLSVFDHFVGLTLKGLSLIQEITQSYPIKLDFQLTFIWSFFQNSRPGDMAWVVFQWATRICPKVKPKRSIDQQTNDELLL